MEAGRNEPCPCGSGKKYKKCCLSGKEANLKIGSADYTFFCDESGNSGGNLLDTEQPFYILGGWMIPNRFLHRDYIVKKLANDLKIENEIKGTNLIRNKRNYQAISEFFTAMGQAHCVPMYIFSEKRYCIAAKLVEVLLDPVSNSRVDNFITYDNEKKKQIAEILYTLSDEVLNACYSSFYECDIPGFESSLKELVKALAETGQTELVYKIEGFFDNLKESLESEFRVFEHLPNKSMKTLNIPTLAALLNLLELNGRDLGHSYRLIHDTTNKLEESYKHMYDLYANAKNNSFFLTDGTEIKLGFEYLKELKFEDSKENLWIQAADILVSTINRLLKAIYRDEGFEEGLKRIALLTLPPIFVADIRLAQYISSLGVMEKIYKNLGEFNKG